MIIFKRDEYNAWAALNEKYLALQAEARRQYGQDKNRKKYESRLVELENLEINERDHIESPALYRTVESLSTKKVYEDAKATIYYYTYKAYAWANAQREVMDDPTIEPEFNTYGDSYDFRVLPHLDVLRQDRDAMDKAEEIDNLIARYKAGQITEAECEPYKDYEMIRVELPVNKTMAPINQEAGTALIIKSTVFPDQFLTPKDKVSNKLFEGAIAPLVETTVNQGGYSSKKDISTLVTLNYDDLAAVELVNRPKGLTAYDREVADAIISLYVVGNNEVVTDQMIYRVITGNPDARLTAQAQEVVQQSVKVLRGTIVNLKASDDLANSYNIEEIYWEGPLISLETVRAKIKGKYVNAYKINRMPVLYRYADSLNQVARVPIELLNTSINKTPEVITLQGYLLRRVVAMKGSNLSRVILYSTILDNIGLEELTHSEKALTAVQRKKIQKIKDFTLRILDEWKEKTFIIDYKLNYKGNTKTLVSVEITP